MERKLVKQGNNALTITLPAGWLKKYKLKSGDAIEIEERGKSVAVTTKKEFGTEKADIDISNLGILTNRAISALYKRGCDEIRIIYKDPRTPEKLHRVLNELVGFEIITQSSKECLVKEISKTSEEDFENILRRSFLLIKLMGQEIAQALRTNKTLEHIPSMDINVNKFANFCLRALNKKGYKDFKRTSSIYFIINQLEHLGDFYKELAMNLEKKRVSKEFIDYLEEINQLYDSYIKLFFDFQQEKAVEFANKWENTRRKVEKRISNVLFAQLRSILFAIIKMFGEQLTYMI